MKRFFLITVLAGVLLAGCQTSTPQVEEAQNTLQAPTAQAFAATIPAASATPGSSATSTTAPEGKQPVSDSSPGCTVQSPFPTPGPTEQSLFPPPRDRDWVTGPDSARITFTEYSDFQ